jgi:hypothetical protein
MRVQASPRAPSPPLRFRLSGLGFGLILGLGLGLSLGLGLGLGFAPCAPQNRGFPVQV